MPNLAQSLHGHDLGYFQIVAQLWGLDLRASDVGGAVREISTAAEDRRLIDELIEALEPRARDALSVLVRADGRMAWAAFAREFGDIREMGVARRDREKPYLKPQSTAEVLYYRAFLARAFFETPGGPREFAYLPDNLLELVRAQVSPTAKAEVKPLGRAATRPEAAFHQDATDSILDEATTRLAARRAGVTLPADRVLDGLLEAAELIKDGSPQAGSVKGFLERPRPEALGMLANAWRESATFNELRLTPELHCEGEWDNKPRETRQLLLQLLSALPEGAWWNLNSFIQGLKDKSPDFQRPAGDYDSWFIKSTEDGQYLRGYESWDQVDGALVRFLLVDVMHRLGMVDLAAPTKEAPVAAIRLLPGAEIEQRSGHAESGRLRVTTQGRITAPRDIPRAVRYQAARFCEWDPTQGSEFSYRVTAASLDRARRHGLKADQLLAMLAQHAAAGLPPTLIKAIKRWESHGVEARTETQVVLRVSRPDIIKSLRASKAARFLGEILGPKAIVIKPGAQAKVLSALTELGLLGDDASIVGDVGASPERKQ